MFEEIDAGTFATKNAELRDRTIDLQSDLETCDRNHNEIIDTAIKAFELSQDLRTKWFAADHAAKRRILEIICLNWTLEGVSLVPTMRKPFDLLAEGLVLKESGEFRTPVELFLAGVSGWEPEAKSTLAILQATD